MNSQLHLFDIPDDVAYFNCAYYSPLLNESRNRLVEGAKSKCHPWERTAPDFFTDAEKIRKSAADLFGGEPDGYAIVPSVSYGTGKRPFFHHSCFRRSPKVQGSSS